MGNLIKVLGKDLENCPHFFLDFERSRKKEFQCDPCDHFNITQESHISGATPKVHPKPYTPDPSSPDSTHIHTNTHPTPETHLPHLP
ncbi:hypothetical protein ABG768_011560 [Culter alburnus]|uniref:Uncharacterized protein n=1 Tax=Culter alburnus TaxID=194366 RepID=A0AAW1Z7J2_CULAL